jgi:hypothetical protein
MEEKWLPVPIEEYADIYEISNTGKYRNKTTKKELKEFIAGKYLMASLIKSGMRKRYMTHRLVACAFVKDPDNDPNKDVVNHIDGNKFNNNASNLEWTTLSGNAKHSRTELKQRKTVKKIIRIDIDGNEVEYESILQASIANNLRRQYITECARGKRESIKGFQWRYADEMHNAHSVNLNEMKEITEFPGYYINEEGKIYGVTKSQFLKYNMTEPYPKIQLYKNGETKMFYVHVLVAKTFIPNPENKLVVDHIDGNKANCNVDNLRWVTNSENNILYQLRRNTSVLRSGSKEQTGFGENSKVQVESDVAQDNPEPSS